MATGLLSIKLRCASWQQLATIYKRDLSRGAMFLKASSPPPIGTSVRIDLSLPSASVIVLTGTVKQHVTDPARGQGVELELAPLPAGSVWMIESALAAESKRQSQQPAAPAATGSQPQPAITDGDEQVSAEQELMRALLAEAESLRKLNPFLVLGVGYEASDADVRAAFGELTKRYHPDLFARYESTELRQTAAEIFILIRDAYRRLGDETGRAQALSSLGRHAGAARTIPRAPTPPSGRPSAKIPPPSPKVPEPAAGKADDAPLEVPTVKPVDYAVPDAARPTSPPVHNAPTARASQSGSISRKLVDDAADTSPYEALIDGGRLEEALAGYRSMAKKHPNDKAARAGVELVEGLIALGQRDRLEAAQRFEAALEIDPSNERAARELADMRRQATNERKGLLTRLMGKKE
ncbi:MAG TPA: DnaJ domain-containing protein [Kofleriaceae bacterium]|jgi:curved DNA-binding protein CbpA|nr:DnaJ domain-containing protein [Kofleriaceae bacterium]